MSEAHPSINVSYWIASTTTPEHPRLEGDVEADVAVVGAGIVGLTAARMLKRAGLTVAVVEMDRVGRGVSGYTTAKITSGHGLTYHRIERRHGAGMARSYARANQAALDLIAGWVEEDDIDCDFERRPNYVYSESLEGADRLKEEFDAVKRAGLPARYVTEIGLPYPSTGAIVLDDQAQFHPLRYLTHLASQLPGDGSYVFERSRVTGVEEGERCVVKSESGNLIARNVILATHYPFLDRGLFFPRVHQKRSYAIAGPAPEGAPTGMFINAESPTRSLRTIPDGDRTLLLVGGNGHPTGQETDTESEYRDLEVWADEWFGLDDIAYRWSSQDGSTVDALPYAGTARRTSKDVYTATGFSKWGMTNGTAAAGVISDAILGRENEFAAMFDPHRVTVSSLPDLVSENLKVAKHFIADRVVHPQRKPFDELAPGEASVERVGIGQVAAYRDPNGELHAVAAECTHLGCAVRWNPAEVSWDCPCHGSRFDHRGRVLHGPATEDLKKKEV
jgi:glycine/D-amino acid oxidase-like deaminating enzyme/nitrite reductase/ring-hydroxylating ferredoxin subunit